MNHGKTMSMILSICSLGNRFVDAFLILSGIGLYYSFKKNDNVLQFYIRRLIKLLPAYCILAIPYWIYYDLFFAKKQYIMKNATQNGAGRTGALETVS